MFARMILPTLGGAPAVWTTAMVFFQVSLLVGYLYAHISTRFLNRRTQFALHITLLCLVFISLPISLTSGVNISNGYEPITLLLLLCTTSIGVPFVVVSSTAPLLQKWFSHLDNSNNDPYFLYAASNAGALLALLAYPTIIEPLLTIKQQAWGWSICYALLVVGILVCGLKAIYWPTTRLAQQEVDDAVSESKRPIEKISWKTKIHWIALSFIPSAMLLGVTLHISTDVAAAPFLWIAPLALYIFSFVLVFARRTLLNHNSMMTLQAYSYVALAVYFTSQELWLLLGLHLAVLFFTAMVCHGRLVQIRPASEQLTEYYLWISFGGMLGGIFSAILAPLLFDTAMEYPLAVIGACLLRTQLSKTDSKRDRVFDIIIPMTLALFYLGSEIMQEMNPARFGAIGPLVFYVVLMFALLQFKSRPIRFTFSIAIVLFGLQLISNPDAVLHQERSFFGIYTVSTDAERSVRALEHRTTIHGAQATDPQFIDLPMTYYNREGPVGQVFKAMNENLQLKDIGAVGLGIGTLACYVNTNQSLRFYEIDPLMVKIANNPELFQFLGNCGDTVDIVIGDGRVMLEKEPDSKFDLLVVDAFSSDAIPVHLLTQEAFAIYMSKLRKEGILLIHVSNRYVDLKPIIANVAEDFGGKAWLQNYSPDKNAARRGAFPSDWILISATNEPVLAMGLNTQWNPLPSKGMSRLWTDDYANLIGALDWGKLLWAR